MAPTLTALERFLERLVERPIGRLFRAPIEPEQLRRRVERSMEEGRRSERGRTVAPDRFRILLQPDDLASLLRRNPAPEPGLRESAHAYARQRGWLLRERPLVTLHPSTAVARGDTVVVATLSNEGSAAAAPGTGGSPSLETTAVLPVAPVGDVALIVSSHGRPDRRIGLAGAVLRIGRAVDNEVVLQDERVSRHHGLITVAHGSLVYRDLASANGSYLRGEPVSEVALGPGDELTLGSTSLRVVRG
jgi:FhaA, N-terminal domain/FHA domain